MSEYDDSDSHWHTRYSLGYREHDHALPQPLLSRAYRLHLHEANAFVMPNSPIILPYRGGLAVEVHVSLTGRGVSGASAIDSAAKVSSVVFVRVSISS